MNRAHAAARLGDNSVPSRKMSSSEVKVSSGGQQVVTGGQQVVTGGQQVVTGGQQVVTGGQQVVTGGQQVVTGGQQVVTGGQQLLSSQETRESARDNNLECSHENEEEDFPRYTTKELRDHFERTIEEAAPHKPIKAQVPKSELCPVCRRRVYPMDGWIVDRKKYHKSCFFCEHCKTKLSLAKYVSLHGRFFCLHHYKQLLKSRGMYDNRVEQRCIPADHKLGWKHSTSSLSSVDRDKADSGESPTTEASEEHKAQGSKISVVWPPQVDSPKKAFKMEEDIQLAKPQWPPPDKFIRQQHRESVPTSDL